MHVYEIKNEFQILRLLDHGATIYEWLCFSDKTSIMLNNQDLEIYKDSSRGYFGSTVGRVANRIANASFKINGETYNIPKNNLDKHNLHSGPNAINTVYFDVVSHEPTKIVFKTVSPDMHNGFPGEVTLYVTYELIGKQMKISYDATSTRDTILNITNHGHFNLGDHTILEHELVTTANRILDVDHELIPTGKLIELTNHPLDFRTKKPLKDGILPLKDTFTKGIDHAFLFEEGKKRIIELSFKHKKLTIETSYPGFQVYTMNRLFSQKTKDGLDIPVYGGVAFECQIEPDAINHPNFNSSILRKGETYQHFILYTVEEV
ncbi:Aldose 1-epimerase [Acholeplasma oculi]|uniref:Aldose 1-epimerase n=1 Tax=Acholeplasma oculi TaxID=35623 RepID=A0A061ABR0_9MOLU|nr:aldose epimerase family protein [Acholeplasma oculi]CDR31243.1 Aldose 1-epimerase [Acholeplasma oculi]SKC38365.1 aldose 1-epimerase [Acholeplasma oculi]SUT91319.1 Aldose 1-epimerase [Acholeplasma oculi]